jgi:hypothetical protein
MHSQQPLPVAAVAATLLLGPLAARQPIACSLLTEVQVSAVLEVKSLPGKPPFPAAQKLCIWSDDPKGAVSNRRVTLSLMTRAAFDFGKSNKQIKVEPVSGIGDEAYYEVFSSDSPLLLVRKGSSAFNIRILNGLKFKPFAAGQVKAKEADLAKAAVAKL